MAAQERNSNRIVPFNSYILLGKVEKVKGFKIYESDGSIPIYRGLVVAAPFETEKALNQGEWVYFRADNDMANELERMFPAIECNDTAIAGMPFIMVTKDKLLFVMLEAKGGLVLPKMPVVMPGKLQ